MIEVRELTQEEFVRVDAALPLHRFDGWTDDGTYLVAWDAGAPVGHVHIAWRGTALAVPELQDAYVLPNRRGEGIGSRLTAAAEAAVRGRGFRACSIGHGIANHGARRLYERLGYRPSGRPPTRVAGTIEIRGEPVEVDDTIVYLVKDLDSAAGVDFGSARSS